MAGPLPLLVDSCCSLLECLISRPKWIYGKLLTSSLPSHAIYGKLLTSSHAITDEMLESRGHWGPSPGVVLPRRQEKISEKWWQKTQHVTMSLLANRNSWKGIKMTPFSLQPSKSINLFNFQSIICVQKPKCSWVWEMSILVCKKAVKGGSQHWPTSRLNFVGCLFSHFHPTSCNNNYFM